MFAEDLRAGAVTFPVGLLGFVEQPIGVRRRLWCQRSRLSGGRTVTYRISLAEHAQPRTGSARHRDEEGAA
jgi:hypothetical protein